MFLNRFPYRPIVINTVIGLLLSLFGWNIGAPSFLLVIIPITFFLLGWAKSAQEPNALVRTVEHGATPEYLAPGSCLYWLNGTTRLEYFGQDQNGIYTFLLTSDGTTPVCLTEKQMKQFVSICYER